MKTIKKFPYIAIMFGAVAVGTAVVLYVGAARWVHIIFAIFWLITGLLGLYQGLKR